jgi:hypothetical protein
MWMQVKVKEYGGMVMVTNLGIGMVILKRMQLVVMLVLLLVLRVVFGVLGGDDGGEVSGVGGSEDLVCRWST